MLVFFLQEKNEVVAARNKAAKAIQALFRELGLPEITDEEVEAATYALWFTGYA